jgi:hypothetical protein
VSTKPTAPPLDYNFKVIIGLVFPFNEVNAAVFQNVAIWNYKFCNQEIDVKFIVYGPEDFRGLYFWADEYIAISPLPYQSYVDVASLEPSFISKRDIRTWFSSGSLNYLHHKILEILPSFIYHSLPLYIKADVKTRYFLSKSGLILYIKRNAKIVGVDRFIDWTSYREFGTFEPKRKNLNQYFLEAFESLSLMTFSAGRSADGVKKIMPINFDQQILASYATDSDLLNSDLVKISELVKAKKRMIYLRTRNNPSKGGSSIHNANPQKLEPLVYELISSGYVVLNSGNPPMRLNIVSNNYLELNRISNIDIEFSIARHCEYVVTSAAAGLFVGWAATDLPLATFDDEWSLTNLSVSISIAKARKSAGLIHVDLEPLLKMGDWGGGRFTIGVS